MIKRLLILTISFLTLNSCVETRYTTANFAFLKNIDEVVLYNPYTYIEEVSRWARRAPSDTLSERCRNAIIDNLFDRNYGLRVKEMVYYKDQDIDIEIIDDLYAIVDRANVYGYNSADLPQRLAESLPNICHDRYLMFVLANGFERTAGSTVGMTFASIGIAIATFGTCWIIPETSHLELITGIIDTEEKRLVYINKSVTNDYSPTNKDAIDRVLRKNLWAFQR